LRSILLLLLQRPHLFSDCRELYHSSRVGEEEIDALPIKRRSGVESAVDIEYYSPNPYVVLHIHYIQDAQSPCPPPPP